MPIEITTAPVSITKPQTEAQYVWVLWRQNQETYYPDIAEVLGVFDSLELAQEAAERHFKEHAILGGKFVWVNKDDQGFWEGGTRYFSGEFWSSDVYTIEKHPIMEAE